MQSSQFSSARPPKSIGNISIFTEREQYSPGDVINGQISFNVTSDEVGLVSLQDMKFYFQGIERTTVHYTTKHNKKTRHHYDHASRNLIENYINLPDVQAGCGLVRFLFYNSTIL